MSLRVGLGFDVHPLVPGRPLVVGGVRISHDRGLDGHSDADVLCHAVADALLGAAADGDLGRHFPSGNPALEGISSLEILRRVRARLAAAGWQPVNVDAVILAEAPRMAPHIASMRGALAAVLQLPVEAVSVKATTTDGLGAMGRGEGIGAQAVALITRVPGAAPEPGQRA